jgi:hypothetical protein
MSRRWQAPACAAMQSSKMTQQWQDPVYRTKMIKLVTKNWTPKMSGHQATQILAL